MIYPVSKVGQLLAGDEVQIVGPEIDTNVTRWAPSVEVAPVGTPLVLRIQTASGASPPFNLSATIAAGAKVATPTVGTMPVLAGATIFVRVVSGPVGGSAASYLTGYFETGQTTSGSAFATLSELKEFLNITTSSQDQILTATLAGVTRRMQNFMRREILAGSATELLNGQGDELLQLTHYPLLQAGVVLIDAVAIDAADLEWDLTAGQVRYGGRFPTGFGNVQAFYDHGYLIVPDDLARACIMQAAFDYRRSALGGNLLGQVSKAHEGGGSTTYVSGRWLPEVEDTLRVYRRGV